MAWPVRSRTARTTNSPGRPLLASRMGATMMVESAPPAPVTPDARVASPRRSSPRRAVVDSVAGTVNRTTTCSARGSAGRRPPAPSDCLSGRPVCASHATRSASATGCEKATASRPLTRTTSVPKAVNSSADTVPSTARASTPANDERVLVSSSRRAAAAPAAASSSWVRAWAAARSADTAVARSPTLAAPNSSAARRDRLTRGRAGEGKGCMVPSAADADRAPLGPAAGPPPDGTIGRAVNYVQRR